MSAAIERPSGFNIKGLMYKRVFFRGKKSGVKSVVTKPCLIETASWALSRMFACASKSTAAVLDCCGAKNSVLRYDRAIEVSHAA